MDFKKPFKRKGVACPHVSDETSYTMVESTGGGTCRCACQEDYDASEDSADASGGCCNPQVFTSILLGILACVLMTGGVFLAFHRWDPMWLMVSGVGVVLVLIGSILHCCSNGNSQAGARKHASTGKGCCSRPAQPDHLHNHIVNNNGSLTEQLLPLSNARSVSQLSLNMLPGYFPPVVTAYGIEQHSAVVQNINRLVQQQQQPQNPGSASPGVNSAAGKSFILLSLPTDGTPANVQNLVATVYQLDGNVAPETTASEVASSSSVATPKPAPNLVLKSVEVQTCNIWPNAVPNPVPVTSSGSSSAPVTSIAEMTGECSSIQAPIQRSSAVTATGTTQTEERSSSTTNTIDLMDCSPEINSVCDNVPSTRDSQPENHSAFVNIPVPSTVLVDVSEPSRSVVNSENLPNVFVDAQNSASTSLLDLPPPPTSTLIGVTDSSDILTDIPELTSDVLIDVSETSNSNVPCDNITTVPEVVVDSSVPECNLEPENFDSEQHSSNLPVGSTETNLVLNISEPSTSGTAVMSCAVQLEASNSELNSSCSNLSDIDAETDDGEFLDRSSPPPSYDDVAHEGEAAVGA
ncbi:hypothetical protein X975_19781, partial [Stegodyphus mimosarum]